MAPPRKLNEFLKDQRVVIMLSKADLDLIDDWSFANRIRSRGEAIRRLIAAGVVKHGKSIKEARDSRFLEGYLNGNEGD